MNPHAKRTIGIVGGTGPEGRGLAARWSAVGHRVILGSRSQSRASEAAAHVAELVANVAAAVAPAGTNNIEAARGAEVVVFAVPYAGQAEVLAAIRPVVEGKIVISVVVPLQPPTVTTVHVPAAGSAAVEAQGLLGPGAKVVAAFHNVAAARLADLSEDVACDVLVCGDDPEAKREVLALVAAAGATGFDAGPLVNSVVPEGLTSVLIGINKRHRSRDAGVRITNLPRASTGTLPGP